MWFDVRAQRRLSSLAMPWLCARVPLLTVLALAGPALAPPQLAVHAAAQSADVAGSPAPRDVRSAAREAFSQGVSAFEAADYRAARDAFARAYALSPHPSVQLNLAFCEERLGRLLAAREHYRAYLAAGVASSEESVEVDQAVRRISAALASVLVALEPSSARLTVDGADVAWQPGRSIDLEPGAHVLRAELPGRPAVEQRVLLASGARMEVALHVAPGAQAEPSFQAGRPLRAWAAGAGLLSLATAGSAVATGVLARRAEDDFSAQVRVANDPGAGALQRAEARSTGEHAADRADTLARATDALIGTAVGFAALTVTLLVIDHKRAPREPSEPRVGSGLAPVRGGALVTLAGRF